jgi:aspartokinase
VSTNTAIPFLDLVTPHVELEGLAKRTVEELRREFAQDLAYEQVEHITLNSTVAIVTVVGKKIRGISGIVGRTFGALGRENVDTVAIAHGASESNISFVVAKKDMRSALVAIHREFQLGMLNSQHRSDQILGQQGLQFQSEQCSANAD